MAAEKAASDRAVAAALRNSATAAPGDDVGQRANVDAKTAGRLETGFDGARESKQADEAELGRAFNGTSSSGVRQTRSTEGRIGGGTAAEDEKENDSEVVLEKEGESSTAVVARAGYGDDAAAEEKKEEEHDLEGGAIEKDGTETSTPAVAGGGNGDDAPAGEKEEEHDVEGDAAVKKDETETSTPAVAGGGNGDDAAAVEKEEEHGGAVVEEDRPDTSTPAVPRAGNGDDDAAEAKEEEHGTEGGAVQEVGVGQGTDGPCSLEADGAREQTRPGDVEDEAGETGATTADKPEADGAVADEEGSSDPSGAE